ncbi:MAG: type II toxin-antitoxin system VapC family toxin [Bryobacteraceae bacterium]
MSGFLLDTNVPSELTRKRPEPRVMAWLEAADDSQLFISAITVGELHKGFVTQKDAKRRAFLEDWFRTALIPWFEGRILDVSAAIAERWGKLDGTRQMKGSPLNTADGLIAATALEYGLTVVTRNVRDFAGLGVEILDPWDGAEEQPTSGPQG